MKFIPSVIMLILMFSAAYAQTELPRVEGRFVELGTNTGLSGQTVELYCNNNKTPDITTTNSNGEINKEVTDVNEETIETKTIEIYIKPSGKIEGINNIDKAVLYNSNGEKVKDITEELQKGKSLTDINIASGIYFLQLQEGKNIYNIKFIKLDGEILGSNKIPITTKTIHKKTFPKVAGYTTLDSVIAYSKDVNRTTFKNFQPFTDSTNIGTLQLELLGYTYHTITTYGVDSDSGTTAQLLTDALIWVGTRDKNNPQNYTSITDSTGKGIIRTPLPGISKDTLFIEAKNYHQRNSLINTRYDNNITEYLITNNIDLYLFETVFFANGQVPLAKPDPKYGNTLPFRYLQTPLDNMWDAYVRNTVTKELARYSGGEYTGIMTNDTTNTYTTIGWHNSQSSGEITMDINFPYNNIIWNAQIYFINISDPTFESQISNVTKKEICNALYHQSDFYNKDTTKIPTAWKKSKFYIGLDAHLYKDLWSWSAEDLAQGRIAGKLPRGYIINVIHKPSPRLL
jgi:hypothetical protein